jgi:two-component system OmpR family sensor kinase
MSLRIRLLLAVGAIVLVALGAATVATYSSLRSFMYGRVDQTLQTTEMAVQRRIGVPPPPAPDQSRPPELPDALTSVAPGTFVQVRDASGTPVAGETQPAILPGGDQYTPDVPAQVEGLAAATDGYGGQDVSQVVFTADSTQSGGPEFRVLVAALPGGGQLVVAVPLTDTLATLHWLLAIELIAAGAALVAAGFLGWWLVRVGLRPLRDIERTAEAIAEGQLHERVPNEDPRTEVGRLSHSLNTMLGRIEDAFAERDQTEAELRASEERLRRFVADASHELRTPLAAVSAYAELLEAGAVERPSDLERVMHGIRNESARMKTLVDDLLLLARLDEGRPLARAPLELVGLAAEAVETANTVAADWPVRLEAECPLEITGDRERLRQVIDNLLANVRAHTPHGTAAIVRLRREGSIAVLEVADDGPGLTAEQAAHVFERFYRADGSRSRERGGAGLGLSIVAAIVGAHGGGVTAANGADGGAVFTIRLPLADATATEARDVPAGTPAHVAAPAL